MDEMNLLEEFCAAEPLPGPQQLARARIRLITAIGSSGSAGSGPGNRRTRWPGAGALSWPELAVAGAAVVAAAVLVVAAVVASPGSSRPADGTKPAVQPGGSAGDGAPSLRLAAYVLHRAAAAALTGPVPRDDQFIYTDTRAAGPGSDVVSRIQSWQSVDGMRAGATRWTRCLMGSQTLPSCLFKLSAGRGANPIDRTYAGLRTLPTRPAAMLTWLTRHNTCDGPAAFGLPEDIAAYAEIFMILGTVQTPPPKIAAALFGAAAKIPGVTVLRRVADAAGGHGVAVAMTFTVEPGPRTMYELVFDPRTYRYIGQQMIAARSAHGPRQLTYATTLITSKVVNAAPTDYTGDSTGGTQTCV